MPTKKRIIVIANKYPNFIEPNVNVFTQQITWCFVEQGYECIVICPVAFNYNKKNRQLPYERDDITESGKKVHVYHPKYYGLGQTGSTLLKMRVGITTKIYTAAVDSILRKIRLETDILFSEFLCPAGVTAAILGKKYNLSAYMQCGEATYQGDKKYGNDKLSDVLSNLAGVIAVSGHNRDYLVDAGIVSKERIIVLPSGYRKDRIFPRDKKIAREKLGLPIDKFIVGFCGSYDNRKGVLRLEKAIDMIEDENVVFAAVGKGEFFPTSKKCVLTGPINHEDLAWFYSAIDVFAFPTYHEGSCTAIVEAIACGCPIISSNRTFNFEICDNTNSILIEPDDIEAMRNNILLLKNDTDLKEQLSKGSLEKSKYLSLDEKTKKIIDFMNLTNINS